MFIITDEGVFIYMVSPIITDISNEIVNAKTNDPVLKDIHCEFCNWLISITNQKPFFFKHEVASTVKNILNQDSLLLNQGVVLLSHIRKWVNTGKTSWSNEHINDIIFLLLKVINHRKFNYNNQIVESMTYNNLSLGGSFK